MKWVEKIEKATIRLAAPALSILVAISGFILGFDFSKLRMKYPSWPGVFDILEHHSWFWVLFVTALLLGFANIFLSLMSPTRENLKEELESQSQKFEAITDHVQFCLEGFLWEQAKKIGFDSSGVSRISLYLHEPTHGRFFCLARRSHNSRLEQKGRSFFKDTEGCIAFGWERDWHFDNKFPDDLDENVDYQKEKYGLGKAEHKKLTMNPRLMAVKKVIDKSDRPVAVIVIESTKRQAFEEDTLRELMHEAALNCSILLTTWKDYLPNPNLAQSEGL